MRAARSCVIDDARCAFRLLSAGALAGGLFGDGGGLRFLRRCSGLLRHREARLEGFENVDHFGLLRFGSGDHFLTGFLGLDHLPQVLAVTVLVFLGFELGRRADSIRLVGMSSSLSFTRLKSVRNSSTWRTSCV